MKPWDTLPFAVSVAGIVAPCLLQLFACSIVKEIIVNKSVGAHKLDLFVIGVISGLINVAYAIVSSQLMSSISSGISTLLYSIYLIVYLCYTTKRKAHISKSLSWILSCLSIASAGVIIFKLVDLSPSGNEWIASHGGFLSIINIWLGVAATVSLVLLVSCQLINLREVIRKKDSSSMSLMLALSSLLCSSIWLLYAALIVNPYYITADSIGVFSGMTQVVLKRLYAPTCNVTKPVELNVKPDANKASSETFTTEMDSANTV